MRLRTNLLLVVAATVVLASSGCSIPNRKGSLKSLSQIRDKQDVAIVYRTDSDRLNLVTSNHATNRVQQAAYQPQAATGLPPVSISTLHVRYPHPAGRKEMAQVNVTFHPAGIDSAKQSESFFAQLTGWGKESRAEQKPIEIWTLDIPKWQVDGIVGKLQKANFFRRSKVLSSNSYLGVVLNGEGFGKNYSSVDELDALIVRVRQQGQPAGPDGRPLPQRRAVATRPPAAHFQSHVQGQNMPHQYAPNRQRPNFNAQPAAVQQHPYQQPRQYQPQYSPAPAPSGSPDQGHRPGYQMAPGERAMPVHQASNQDPNAPEGGQRMSWSATTPRPGYPPTFQR